MKVSWCQEHETNGGLERCRFGGGCRMVPMRLIPDNAETAEVIAQGILDGHYGSDDAYTTAEAILAALDGETP